MPKADSENIVHLAEDLRQRRIIATSLPAVLYVESVYGCPYSCIICEVRELKPHLISEQLLKKIWPLYPHLYMLAIHGDGEPLLGEGIGYFINVARQNNIMLHMNSTGFFLGPDLIDRLLSATKLSIRFSIHAGNNRTYAKIMGHDLDKVKENIKYFLKRNAEIGNQDNEFWLSYIVMKENIDEMQDFLYLAHQIGIRHIRFMKLVPNRYTIKGILRENFRFYYSEQFNSKIKKEFLKRLPEIKDLAKRLGITVEPGDLEFECSKKYIFDNVIIQKVIKKIWQKKYMGFCIAPWIGGCIVKQSGDIVLCCSSPFVIGNLFKQDFKEIWNSGKVQHIRKEFSSGRLLKSCGNCSAIRMQDYPSLICREFKEKLNIS